MFGIYIENIFEYKIASNFGSKKSILKDLVLVDDEVWAEVEDPRF